MNDYKKLNIWKRSTDLLETIYHITEAYPATEKYRLVDQMRRAASSIPSNIAEGCGRTTVPQLIYFINFSLGSLSELESQVISSKRLKYISQNTFESIIDEISQIKKMTWSFIRSRKKHSS